MTNIFKQAAHVAADISRKEAEISAFRADQRVEEDKFNLIGILAVEARTQNFRKGSKKAGQFLEAVCFDVLGQKNKTGKGKKLAENAAKLAKHNDFDDIIARFEGDDNINLTAGEFRSQINQRCEELHINSYNKLVAYLNPKEELTDLEKIIALATKIIKDDGGDVESMVGKDAITFLIFDAYEKARNEISSYHDDDVDQSNVTPIKSAA